MVKKLPLLFIIVTILAGCVEKDNNRLVFCNDFPNEINCVCPKELLKKSTPVGDLCTNISCKEFSLNGSCVKSCPDGYIYSEILDKDENKFYHYCIFIKNQSEMLCSKYPLYDNCICPEGKKSIITFGGRSCVDESFCEDFTLSDNQSACVQKCPEGYIKLIVTDTGSAGTCINAKTINKDNFFWYWSQILSKSDIPFLKRYNENCPYIGDIELNNKFGLKFMCRDYPETCSFYIFPNKTVHDNGCLDNSKSDFYRDMVECDKDDDCKLVVSGCPKCHSCKVYEISDPKIIAVNKKNYDCPPENKSYTCAACVDILSHDESIQENDKYNDLKVEAICVNSLCEKKILMELKGKLNRIASIPERKPPSYIVLTSDNQKIYLNISGKEFSYDNVDVIVVGYYKDKNKNLFQVEYVRIK